MLRSKSNAATTQDVATRGPPRPAVTYAFGTHPRTLRTLRPLRFLRSRDRARPLAKRSWNGRRPVARVRVTNETVLQRLHVEVEQQPELVAAELQVRDELRVMNRVNCVDRLQLDDDELVYQQIEPKTCVDDGAVIAHGDWHLLPHAVATLR